MDKNWMLVKDRWCLTYVEGVRDFPRIANNYAGESGKIRCPCKNCNYVCVRLLYEVKQHLFLYGILEDYSPWIHHGEPSQSCDQNEADELCEKDGRGDRDEIPYNDVGKILDELQTGTFANARVAERSSSYLSNVPEKEVEKFERLLRDAKSELPYWSTLVLRHNLNIMHIEKNIMEILLGTLLNIEGKTKDSVKARLDLELMGIRKELHAEESERQAEECQEELQAQRSTITKSKESQLELQQAFKTFVARFGGRSP